MLDPDAVETFAPLETLAVSDTDSLIAVRGSTHGHYPTQAAVTQEIKRIFRSSPNWPHLTPVEADALDMMACKLGRVLVGDPHYFDHWKDLAGYARLVEKECVVPDA